MKKIAVVVLSFCWIGVNAQFDASKKKDFLITIKTDYGTMQALLYDAAPKHKTNFVKLAAEGFYDSTTFHRLIKEFMIQGGDPNSKDANPANDGQGGPGYRIDAEIKPELFHKKGALAAARTGGRSNPEKKSSGSQFYIVQGKKYPAEVLERFEKGYGKVFSDKQKKVYAELGGTPHLDGDYTVFGELISGIDVLDMIAAQPKDRRDRPTSNVYMFVSVKEMKKKKITKVTGFEYYSYSDCKLNFLPFRIKVPKAHSYFLQRK